MVVTGVYDPYLVALSILVAVFASYTALSPLRLILSGIFKSLWFRIALSGSSEKAAQKFG
jgi:NO-binding membrane sensor protein with MHYT domain